MGGTSSIEKEIMADFPAGAMICLNGTSPHTGPKGTRRSTILKWEVRGPNLYAEVLTEGEDRSFLLAYQFLDEEWELYRPSFGERLESMAAV